MRAPRTATALLCCLGGLASLAAGCSSADTPEQAGSPAGQGQNPAPAAPSVTGAAPGTALKVEQVTAGLDNGWDVGFLPDGKLLVSQRPGKLTLVSGSAPGSAATEVRADFSDVLAEGEGGLMGMVVHPDFATSRKFTTCQTHTEGGKAADIRLVTWTLAADGASASKAGDLLTGLPVNPSGRHSGCRPTLAPDGALLVGTGDTARSTVAQDRSSLGGKLLRIDLNTGKPLPDNPFIGSADPVEQRIYSYGHRNVQGVAVRPGTDQVLTAEHGPTFDDEVNLSVKGANYGWDPSKGGTDDSYDESVPMTDKQRFPDAVDAVWTTGRITEAISGADFLTGPQWGELQGRLAVAALKGQKLLLLTMDDKAKVTEVLLPPEFDDKYGRLRAVRSGPDGALYLTTSDGGDDKLLRVTHA